MTRFAAVPLAGVLSALLPSCASAQAKRYPLESVDNLRLQNVTAETVTFQGKKGLRLTLAEETARRLESLTPGERARDVRVDLLAWIEGLDFSSGVIEVEIAGARGFVGIAFRLQEDGKTYDAFYLHPTNGRDENQERRNHSAQYISHPEW